MSEVRVLNCLCRGYFEGLLHSRTERPLDSISEVQSAVGVRIGNSLHISCRNSASTKSFPQSSLTIHFYLKAIRGKLDKITLECDVLFEARARFEPSLHEALRPCNASIPDKRSASAFHSTLGSLNTADIQGCPTARLLLPLPSDRKT